MRRLQTLAAFATAIALVLCMGSFAFAEGTSGSITVTNAVEGQTYTAYRILDLESYSDSDGDGAGGAYSYKANAAWESWLRTQLDYVEFNEAGYVTWKDGADVAAFAKLAQKYAAAQGIAPAADPIKATSSTVVFANMPLGYYLIDSAVGVLCILDTTNPNIVMEEKNTQPAATKYVKEDSTGTYGSSCTAQIGDMVDFKVVITVGPGAEGYVLHDKMSAGLTLDEESVQIAGLIKGGHYTLETSDLCEDCSFHIVFNDAYLEKVTETTDLELTYSATLNGDAVMASAANANEVVLAHGEGSETAASTVQVFSYLFDLVKTDSSNALLEGAQFALYDAEVNGKQIALVKESDGVYRPATPLERNAAGFAPAVIEGAQVVVKGLDADTTYWVEEVKAPDGYNKLTSRVEVAITSENLLTSVTDGVWQAGGVHVVNQSGAELPSTGGAGTTALYAVGATLVLGACVVVMLRKRQDTRR